MRLDDWLTQKTIQLKDVEITTARLDCLVLLADELNQDKSWLLSHPEHELQGPILEALNTKIIRRSQHTPLAYIRGHAEFYGREFIVNAHTLVPRPETETIIELLKRLNYPEKTRILDIGTGSGCIAITAALELPDTTVSACDVDPACVEVAQRNAVKLKAPLTIFTSNLLSNAPPQDVLITNLPYVPDTFPINAAAEHEPHLALFGGPDGLDLYRELFKQIRNNSWQPEYLLTESLPTQHDELGNIARAAGFTLQTVDDFIQVFASKQY